MKLIRYVLIVFYFSIQLGPVSANEYVLADAERFAQLFIDVSELDEKSIKSQYIDLGTKGLEIFTPYRIENEQNLIHSIRSQPKAYEKAINLCLPAAREISNEVEKVINDVNSFLRQNDSAPVYILFGVNNSGGTATHEGLVLGLEVLCQFANNKEQAKEVILSYVAHELVHVYQERVSENQSQEDTLLYQSIVEGLADFVANRVLGRVNSSEIDRHNYGLKNEEVLWSEFKKVMRGTEYQPWMYGESGQDRPRDLGYWLGKRIVEAYYKKATNKAEAIKQLLFLNNPSKILEISGYDPK